MKEEETTYPTIYPAVAEEPEMTLLERITLLDRPQWLPPVCEKCGEVNPGHTTMECHKYEECRECQQSGALGFLKRHSCSGGADETISWYDESDEIFWNQYD